MSTPASNPVQILRSKPGNPISGVVETAMPYGILVRPDPSESENLILADGKRGWMLMLDVLADNAASQAIMLQEQVFGNLVRTPRIVGDVVDAHDVHFVAVEGATHIDASLDENTAVDTPVTTAAGKYAAATSGDEIQGYVREQLTPLDSGNDCRLKIEWMPGILTGGNGTHGTAGTSGTSGTAGTAGTSGIDGTSGT